MSIDPDDIVLPPTKDVQFKPACGELLEDGQLLVSGMQLSRDEVRSAGKSYMSLTEVLRSVKSGENAID